MDPLIRNLKSTTFFGNRLTRQQIANIQETVRLSPGLSRAELGRTIWEHLGWRTPKGRPRLSSTQRLLTEIERLALPPKRGPRRGPQKPIRPGPPPAGRPSAPRAGTRPRGGVRQGIQRAGRALPSARLPPAAESLSALLPARPRPAPARLPAVRLRRPPCRDRWIGWQGLKHLPICASSCARRGFLCCLGSACLALSRTCWPASSASCPATGTRATPCGSSCLKPSAKRPASTVLATAPPTGPI